MEKPNQPNDNKVVEPANGTGAQDKKDQDLQNLVNESTDKSIWQLIVEQSDWGFMVIMLYGCILGIGRLIQ